jgi:hypothetical protein
MAKNEGKLSTSQLIMVHNERNCISFLPLLDGLDYAKKPFHTTVPLTTVSVVEQEDTSVCVLFSNGESVLKSVLP